MEDVFDAAWREHPASHDTQVDAQLASLIDIRGLALLDDPKLLRQLLLQKSPDAQRHVGALLAALTADVPKRLVAAKDDEKLPELLRGAARQLQDQAGLDAEWSTWAVRTWAHAFALPTSGLDETTTGAAVAPSFASPIASARPTRADGFDHVGTGTIGGLWDHSPVKATDPQPALREPTLRDTDDFAPARSEPGFAVQAPSAAPHPADEIATQPLPAEPPIDQPVADEPVVAPVWDTHRPAELRTRSMAGPIVMVVIVAVVALVAWFALEGTPWSTTPTRTASSVPTPTPEPASRPVEQARPVDPPATAEPTPTPSAASTAPATPVDETPRDATPAETAPVVTAPKLQPPVEATPTPAPAAARRPVIARVDVPTVVEGAPFTVGLQLGTGAGDVASIERRVVDSDGAWPKLPTQLQASGLQRSGERTLLIPFRAMDAPSRAIVEFVAIGRDGVRSDAKRVAIALHQPDPAIAALEIPAACTSATCGVVIESREIEPEVGTRGAIYQLSVRMDDRQVVTSTAPYRLQIGSRARMAGTRLVPADRPVP